MCYGCSKAPSYLNGSFEYQQHRFWLRNKKMILKYALLSGGLDNGSFCTGHRSSEAKLLSIKLSLSYPPAKFVCGGYTVFKSLGPCVRPSVTFCFLNILKIHCWIFIKPCKHVHICKTNILNKKVRARGQFY